MLASRLGLSYSNQSWIYRDLGAELAGKVHSGISWFVEYVVKEAGPLDGGDVHVTDVMCVWRMLCACDECDVHVTDVMCAWRMWSAFSYSRNCPGKHRDLAIRAMLHFGSSWRVWLFRRMSCWIVSMKPDEVDFWWVEPTQVTVRQAISCKHEASSSSISPAGRWLWRWLSSVYGWTRMSCSVARLFCDGLIRKYRLTFTFHSRTKLKPNKFARDNRRH